MKPINIRVFVSSTWLDLRPERAAVETLMQRFRETKFIGMEYFGSREETTRQVSLAKVEESDLYIGIIGGRYGSGITEDEQRRLALDAFYQLTYIVPKTLARFPDTAQTREQVVHDNLVKLKQLFKLSDGAHDVLRELATNYRLLATILMEQKKLPEAYKAFQKSAAHCASLVILQPNNALYHRDCAISHLNSGLILEQQGDVAAAREEYLESLESAGSAAELNPQWLDLARDAESRVGRLKDNGP